MKRWCNMNKQQYIWKQQEKHKEFENINAVFYQLVKMSGFIMEPIILGEVFFRYLQKQKASDKNKQTARNMSKVFSILCQYNFINGKVYKNENGFAVSPSVWQKHCIGRDALETSIKYLKELSALQDTLALFTFVVKYFKHRCDSWTVDWETLNVELSEIQKKYKELADKLSAEKWENDEYRQEMLIAAEGVCLLAELSQKVKFS